jgi:hypothetical protein
MRTTAVVLCSLVVLFGSVRPAGAGDDGRALVQKAIQAAGGEAKLAPFQTATWSEKGIYYGMGDGLPYVGKYAIGRPDRFRMEIEGVFIIVLNGDKGWITSGGQTKDMSKEQLEVEQKNHRASWMSSLLPLRDPAFTVKTAGSGKVGDREARVVVASREGYPTVKLFFDQDSGLLLRVEHRAKSPELNFKEVTMEETLSNYREVDGARLPHRIDLKRDGQRFVEADVMDWRAAPKLDPKTFDRPGN